MSSIKHVESAPAPATSATLHVAPPQLFASPFLPQHERAIASVLKQIFPSNLNISRSTMTIVQRISDRLAHYLIHRASNGLNGGMQAKLDALCAPPFLQSAAVAAVSSAAASFADSHAIHFAFDEPLWTELTELCRHAHGFTALTKARTIHFMLPLVLADRWMQDFTLGLRFTDDDAVLPSLLHSAEQKVRLCTVVEYILSEILELAGNAAQDRSDGSIRLSDLWKAVEKDGELQALCRFLPVDWRISAEAVESPLQLACPSQPLDAAQHSSRLLEAEFALSTAAQAELNRSSWYQDSAAVIEAARLVVRGDLVESAIMRQLRAVHVRPLRYWGVTASSRLPARFRDALAGTNIADDLKWREYAFVSFLLADAHGHESEFLLFGDRGERPVVICFVMCGGSWIKPRETPLAAALCHTQQFHALPNAVSLALTVDPSGLIDNRYQPHGMTTPTEAATSVAPASHMHMKPRQDEEGNSTRGQLDASSASAVPASASSSAAAASSSSVPASFAADETVHSKRREKQLKEHTAAELEAAFRAARPLLKFSLYGPTLYSDNNPPLMRRQFTAHLIDESMLAADLAPLPLVLSELIADYHSFELPFREDKAAEQMRRAGFKLREQDPIEVTYDGQLDSAVERVCDVEAQLDRRFPVIDPDADDEEDD